MTRSARILSTLPTLCAGLIGLIAGKVGICSEGGKSSIQIPLVATAHSTGKIGTAVLSPIGDKTYITLTVSGVPENTTRPVHLNSVLFEGSCEKGKSGVSYDMNDRILAESVVDSRLIAAFRGPVRISHKVAIPLEKIRATPFAISVSQTPVDGNRELFCGNIPPQIHE